MNDDKNRRQEIAKQYKRRRMDIGTQATVAELLGVTRETVSRRETAADRITQEAALALEWVAFTAEVAT